MEPLPLSYTFNQTAVVPCLVRGVPQPDTQLYRSVTKQLPCSYHVIIMQLSWLSLYCCLPLKPCNNMAAYYCVGFILGCLIVEFMVDPSDLIINSTGLVGGRG